MGRQKENVSIDQIARRRRHRVLVEHAAPGDVTGVTWRGNIEGARPHGRMQAVGADQQIARDFCAIGENRGDIAVMLNNILKLHARPVAGVRQKPPQRAVKQRP